MANNLTSKINLAKLGFQTVKEGERLYIRAEVNRKLSEVIKSGMRGKINGHIPVFISNVGNITFEITTYINDMPDQFGNTVKHVLYQKDIGPKDRIYVGNGKEFDKPIDPAINEEKYDSWQPGQQDTPPNKLPF